MQKKKFKHVLITTLVAVETRLELKNFQLREKNKRDFSELNKIQQKKLSFQ